MRRARVLPVSVFVCGVIALACGPSATEADSVAPVNVAPSDASSAGSSEAGITDSGQPGTPVPDAAVVGDGDDHCAKATVIPLATPRSELHADTTKAIHDIDAPCTQDGAPDVFYQFTASKRLIVYADTFGASWNTTLFLLSESCQPLTASTMSGDAVCNDDECGGAQSRIIALLEPGNYRLGVGGRGGAVGTATVHFEFVLAPSGTTTELPQGKSQQSGATQGNSGNVQEEGCLAAGPENGYWWATCPSDPGGTLTASTCDGATWETLLTTAMPRASTYACSSGTCNLQTEISAAVPAGAGLHELFIDGQAANSSGPYVMQVTRP